MEPGLASPGVSGPSGLGDVAGGSALLIGHCLAGAAAVQLEHGFASKHRGNEDDCSSSQVSSVFFPFRASGGCVRELD